jgi:hypothetical protein
VLLVLRNQGIELLCSFGSHMDKGVGKWYREKKGSRGVGGTTEKKRVSNDTYHYN